MEIHMNQEQTRVWRILQHNRDHRWLAEDLIGSKPSESVPFFDPVMSTAFLLLAVAAVVNFWS
jgi:hypothetical protein